MQKLSSAVAKVFALIVCAISILSINYMNRHMMQTMVSARNRLIYAQYAFLIFLPLLSFCMAAAFEKIYAAILVFIFDCAFAYGILRNADYFFAFLFPLLQDDSAPLLYYISSCIRLLAIIPYAIICLGLLPYSISNTAIKYGHRVYRLLWCRHPERAENEHPNAPGEND